MALLLTPSCLYNQPSAIIIHQPRLALNNKNYDLFFLFGTIFGPLKVHSLPSFLLICTINHTSYGAVGLSRERGSLLLLDQRKLVCSATIGFHGERGCYLTFTPPCKTTTESFSLKVLDTFFGDRLSSLICYQIVDV